ncbi:MAG: DUF1573 domain-containing protein [Flavobacteriaceae bacterium]|nr:DUF1573 domain-containing protein [Flavobacteriaceae bacterium]
MKVLNTLLIVFLFTLTANAQEFKFESELINYGEIEMGSNGKRVFEFTNTGKAPLFIKNIRSSCGCTVPEKPKEPIMPGKKGKITVSYDTNKLGGFSKQITIYSNVKANNGIKIVRIKGNVVKKGSLEKEKSMLSN